MGGIIERKLSTHDTGSGNGLLGGKSEEGRNSHDVLQIPLMQEMVHAFILGGEIITSTFEGRNISQVLSIKPNSFETYKKSLENITSLEEGKGGVRKESFEEDGKWRYRFTLDPHVGYRRNTEGEVNIQNVSLQTLAELRTIIKKQSQNASVPFISVNYFLTQVERYKNALATNNEVDVEKLKDSIVARETISAYTLPSLQPHYTEKSVDYTGDEPAVSPQTGGSEEIVAEQALFSSTSTPVPILKTGVEVSPAKSESYDGERDKNIPVEIAKERKSELVRIGDIMTQTHGNEETPEFLAFEDMFVGASQLLPYLERMISHPLMTHRRNLTQETDQRYVALLNPLINVLGSYSQNFNGCFIDATAKAESKELATLRLYTSNLEDPEELSAPGIQFTIPLVQLNQKPINSVTVQLQPFLYERYNGTDIRKWYQNARLQLVHYLNGENGPYTKLSAWLSKTGKDWVHERDIFEKVGGDIGVSALVESVVFLYPHLLSHFTKEQ